MKIFWLIIILLNIAFAGWSDLYITSSASAYLPYETEGLNLESHLTWDNYNKLTEQWSLFSMIEILQIYDYLYDPDSLETSASVDLSYREDLSLNLISLTAREVFTDLQSLPDPELDIKLLFSRPLGDIFIQWEPQSRFYFGQTQWADLSTAISLSMAPATMMILQPVINLTWNLYAENSPDFLIDISTELSHYLNSDLSLVYALSYAKSFSNVYTELFLDENTFLLENSKSFDKIQAALELSWYSPKFRINSTLIAAIQWQQYGAIANNTILTEKEWFFELSPDLELIFGFFDPLLFSFFYESHFGFSNSDYLNYKENRIGLEASLLL